MENPELVSISSNISRAPPKLLNEEKMHSILIESDYMDIMTKYKSLYVDKTLWIKEVIESK
jgi:hypothetical protein